MYMYCSGILLRPPPPHLLPHPPAQPSCSSGLVMLQTTNMIINGTLYDKATPNALLAWHRVRLANWLAEGGKEWADIVSKYNSGEDLQRILLQGKLICPPLPPPPSPLPLPAGTYNNQYMVLDLKKVELKKAIHDDALWVVEQIPGSMNYCYNFATATLLRTLQRFLAIHETTQPL